MTKRQQQLIREYREGVINRRSFIYMWRNEQEFELIKYVWISPTINGRVI